MDLQRIGLSPSLRPAQAAELLGIGVSTLWKWQAEREDFKTTVRARRLGPKCTVFDRAELLAWRDAQLSRA
jgi:prophage regulatory protein